jgi:hypothetical protein
LFTLFFRQENQVILRARLEVIYEKKEAARRAAEWEKRGVLPPDELPRPELELLGLNDDD